QRARAARRPASGRSQAALARRDRRAQRRLQAILAGNLARLGVLGHARRLRAPAVKKRIPPVASERSLIVGRITRPDATPRNPNAMIRKGADTALNKTRYDIRRLNRLLNVRAHSP